MQNFDQATLDALNAGRIVAQACVWIRAENISTELDEDLAFCTGAEDLTLSIGGAVRTYKASGAMFDPEPIVAAPGLEVRSYRLPLGGIDASVEALVKGYRTRFAPVKIHRALFDPETRALVAEPHRIFSGFINGIDWPSGMSGDELRCNIDCMSHARVLTRPLPLSKSHAAQQERGGDQLRKYADLGTAVPVYWGTAKAS